MKILVVGSGGREHSLVWKIRQSKKAEEVYCAPGNAGMTRLATCIDIDATDVDGLLASENDHAAGAAADRQRQFAHDDAVAELKRCSGSQFDPEVVDIFLRLMKRLHWP